MNEHKIYFSLIIATKAEIVAERIKQELDLDSDDKTLNFFMKTYKTAYKFFYNDFFERELDIKYLGYVCENEPDLGPFRLDFVLIKNNLFNINTLHIHFNFLKLDFNWESKDDPTIKNLSQFFIKIYNFVENKNDNVSINCFRKLKKILLSKNKRMYTFPISRYIYISVCNLNESKIKDWDNFATNIWRLLYFQPEGIEENIAKETLSKNKWSSTDFFWNFYQPGALVSLSAPYPEEIYSGNIKWFLPKVDNKCNMKTINHPNGEENGDYNLLPEYPSLRYLGLLSLEFTGFMEEILRHLYEELLILQKGHFKIIKSIFKLPKIDALYYKSKSLEYLRLPITREFVSTLVSSKMQETIDENIRDLRTSTLNTMIFILTIVALIIASIQIIPIMLKIMPMIFYFFSKFMGLLINKIIWVKV